ncbi:3,4-dihydroxybenzoate decarboxylase (plasmid) [Candidatus Pantoea edessiphila]|uniref:3,4-dihydroxybenzoate decarboxylase n=1 Tax=Candidatus Pantoea edessiphila TaxID=2044610 RepID=A0A2P5SX95_9GAMM|nr:UbiD family decarboxylase [Candidatus Pantoea edessiphila]PPI86956.1 3,4-dihydroxybenzoate decarboxylase [Candidatus Pantoea edessiphila]
MKKSQNNINHHPKHQTTIINDLRSSLKIIKNDSLQYIETNFPIDPKEDLAGVYRHIGAGGTVMRPTKIGPAMIFNNIKRFPKSRILVGLMASRQRVGKILNIPYKKLGIYMANARKNIIPPVVIKNNKAKCQEIIYNAKQKFFDIRKILPTITNTINDAGPYLCLGLVLSNEYQNPKNTNVSIHRLCMQSKNELSIFFAPGRHIDTFRKKAELLGKSLAVSINIGLDPAIYIGAEFEAPTAPFGFNELSIAGGLRKKPVELVNCISIKQKAIAKAEIVIEGEILPNVRIPENKKLKTGLAMPEFLGYTGIANPALPMIKVKAITTRKNPILQTIIGPGEEHVNLVGIPTEASIYLRCEEAIPGLVKNVYAHSAGGGKLLAILQVNKRNKYDDGLTRQAALVALSVYRELKNIFLIDEDVDLFDTNDVLWAMQTRYLSEIDTISIPGITGHILDPSQNYQYNQKYLKKGITTKTIFDCTVPYNLKNNFIRTNFKKINPSPWLKK